MGSENSEETTDLNTNPWEVSGAPQKFDFPIDEDNPNQEEETNEQPPLTP